MADVLLEVCVDSLGGLEAAVAGGADRIELCAALELGGLTPSVGFMAEAERLAVPVLPLIRPRPGGFVYSGPEVAMMAADIAAARRAGLAGVVIGAAGEDGRLDLPALRQLAAAAKGMSLTLHRVFDMTPDRGEALEQAIALGFDRVLTSGGAPAATGGLAQLAALARQADGRIVIMPGGGISAETIPAVGAAMRLSEIHGSFSGAVPVAPSLVAFGMAGVLRQTEAARVRAARQALESLT